MDIRACLFDVFGTLVDWRTSVARDLESFARRKDLAGIDWTAFAVEWRRLYQPSMEQVRSGKRPWTILDVLHRESLEQVVRKFGVRGLTEAELQYMTRAWHRLSPWPDVVPGLVRLRKRYLIAPCSNGNIALMVNLARHAGFPWDAILGAETSRAYKPKPEAYLASCRHLDLAPASVLMVAAHNSDLKAAKEQGLRTAFVPRPTEHGPGQTTDLAADPSCVDLPAADFVDLAKKLGA